MQYPLTTSSKPFSNQFQVHQEIHNKLNPQTFIEPMSGRKKQLLKPMKEEVEINLIGGRICFEKRNLERIQNGEKEKRKTVLKVRGSRTKKKRNGVR